MINEKKARGVILQIRKKKIDQRIRRPFFRSLPSRRAIFLGDCEDASPNKGDNVAKRYHSLSHSHRPRFEPPLSRSIAPRILSVVSRLVLFSPPYIIRGYRSYPVSPRPSLRAGDPSAIVVRVRHHRSPFVPCSRVRSSDVP